MGSTIPQNEDVKAPTNNGILGFRLAPARCRLFCAESEVKEKLRIGRCGERRVTLPVLSGTVETLLMNMRSTGRVRAFNRFFRPECDIGLSDARN